MNMNSYSKLNAGRMHIHSSSSSQAQQQLYHLAPSQRAQRWRCRPLLPQQQLSPPLQHTSSSPSCCRAAKRGSQGGGRSDDVVGSLLQLADKFVGVTLAAATGAANRSRSAAANRATTGSVPFTGAHALLLALAAVWAATGLLGLLPPAALALDRARPWTALTDAFASPTADALARRAFFGYIFGRAVCNAEGAAGVWLGWLLSAAGGGAAALALLPRRAALAGSGAAGAVFGLFAMATVFHPRKGWHWHRWFELAALLPFVVAQLSAPAWIGAAGGGGGGGAAAAAAGWCVVAGVRLPAAWVPLLGGLAGAAAAAATLALARIVVAGVQQQRRQQQQQQQQQGGGPAGPGAAANGAPAHEGGAPHESVPALLGRAATLFLKGLV